jgi:hypothetical protein
MEASIVGEVYASQKQQDRSQLSSTPEHLSRVLYIPCHSVTTSYLALYHVSSLWIEATGDGPPVAYTVKFTTGDKDAVVGTVEYHVQPESTGTVHAQVELYAALPVDTKLLMFPGQLARVMKKSARSK